MQPKTVSYLLTAITGFLLADATSSLILNTYHTLQADSGVTALIISLAVSLVFVYGGYLGIRLLRGDQVIKPLRTYLGVLAVVLGVGTLVFGLTGAGVEPLGVLRTVFIIGGWLVVRTESVMDAVNTGYTPNTTSSLVTAVAVFVIMLAL